jgi:hypothetical protein
VNNLEPQQPASGNIRRQYNVTDTELKHHSQELGLLGKLFGSKENAPINIAGGLILIGAFSLILIPFLPASTDFSKGDMAKSLGTLILSALTFLGGYLGGSRGDS